jgi:hypothetical protein
MPSEVAPPRGEQAAGNSPLLAQPWHKQAESIRASLSESGRFDPLDLEKGSPDFEPQSFERMLSARRNDLPRQASKAEGAEHRVRAHLGTRQGKPFGGARGRVREMDKGSVMMSWRFGSDRIHGTRTAPLAALALLLATGAAGTAQPTPTPAEEVLDVPSRDEVERMLQRSDLAGAQVALGKIRGAAYRDGDSTRWFTTLLEETRLLIQNGPKGSYHEELPAAYENAIRFVESAPAPHETTTEAGRMTLIADLHFKAAECIDWSQTGDRMAEMKPHLDAADAAFAQAFARRTRLRTVPRLGQLHGYFGRPHHATARDALTYQYVALLTYRAVVEVALKRQIAGLDAAALLHLGVPDPGSAAHPLARAAALLDDLERWHAQAGRREDALEARLERDHAIYALLPGEKRTVVVKDLRRRLPEFRDVTWWSMGMAELALDVNDSVASPTEALAIAEEGARAYPASPGGKDCAAIAKIIRLSLDDPRASVRGVSTASPLGPVLAVSHQGPAVVYLRAGHRPDATVDGLRIREFFDPPWGYQPTPMVPEPRASKDWKVELAAPANGREVEDLLEIPLKEKGLYRVEASLVSGRREDRVASVPVLVTDLILTIFDDRDDLCVRALSASNGRPVEGATVRMLEPVPGQHPSVKEIGSAVTGPEGLARFAWPKQRAQLVVVGHRGDDAARAALPQGPPTTGGPLSDCAGVLAIDRTHVSTGDRVRWRAFVQQRAPDGSVLGPASSVPVTVSLRWGTDPTSLATASGTTDAFGTAIGEFTVPTLPTGARADGWWVCDLERAAMQPGAAPQRLSSAGLSGQSPTSDLGVTIDQSPAPRVGKEVRFSGCVIDGRRRPVGGARVSWEIKGPDVAPRPPRERERGPQEVTVGSGEMVTNGDGRFRASAHVAAFPDIAWWNYSLLVTARDEQGHVVSVRQGVMGGPAAVAVSVRGASIALTGETVSLLLRRSWTADSTAAPGSSTVRLLRQPQYPEVAVAAYDLPLSDQSYPNRPMLSPDASERALARFPDGPEVWRTTVHHDVDGLARACVKGLEPGLYRVVIESADGFGGTARASHPVVVAGPSVRVPAPLVLLEGVDEEGPHRVYVAGHDPNTPVVLDFLRPNRALETRIVAGGAGVVVDLSGDGDLPLVVRATTVLHGRVLFLERSLEGRQHGGLRVTFERYWPTLVVRVTDAQGMPADDVQVAALATNSDQWPFGVDPRWPARYGVGALSLSDNGFRVYATLVPKSASEWGTVSAPRIYAESLTHIDFQPPPAMCGTGLDPPPRPTLHSLATLNAMPSISAGPIGSPFVDDARPLWEPRLRPDAKGRVRLELHRPATGRAYRIAVAAVARDGRVGFADAVVRGPEAGENKP